VQGLDGRAQVAPLADLEVAQQALSAGCPSSAATRPSWVSVMVRVGPIGLQPCDTPMATGISELRNRPDTPSFACAPAIRSNRRVREAVMPPSR
jgi:hypothetical protein